MSTGTGAGTGTEPEAGTEPGTTDSEGPLQPTTILPADSRTEVITVVPAAGPGRPDPPAPHDPGPQLPAPMRPLYVLSSALTVVGILAITFGLTISVIGSVRHARDQQTGFAELRGRLANATSAVTQTDAKGRLQPLGTPIAVLDIPQIGVREVVFEGTNSGVLRSGPGHRRDSAMPGQEGVSVIMGRQAAYGGPFKNLKNLKPGHVFTITTGQGKHTFRVIGRRLAGDPIPAPVQAGKGRVILITAAGTPWVPEGVLRVDADLVTPVQPSGPRPLTSGALPPQEQALEGNPAVWIWVLLLTQALLAVSVTITWARYRWGGRQAWLAGGPVLLALGVALTDQVAALLPNLT